MARLLIFHILWVHTQPTFPVAEEYAKIVFLVYKPWHGSFTDTLKSKQSILEQYEEFKNSIICPELVRIEYKNAVDHYRSHYKEPNVATGNEPPEGAEHDMMMVDPDTAEAVQLYGTLCANVNNTCFDMDDFDIGSNYVWTLQHCSMPKNMTPTEAGT